MNIQKIKERVASNISVFLALVEVIFYFTTALLIIFLKKNQKIIISWIKGTLIFLVLLMVIPYIIMSTLLDNHIYFRVVFLVVYGSLMAFISALRIVPNMIEMSKEISSKDFPLTYDNELWATTAISMISALILSVFILAVW